MGRRLSPVALPHDRGAPGAKSFVDDLILGQGFVRSRAAPSLRSIENQPSTQAFVAPAVPAPCPRRRGKGRPPGSAVAEGGLPRPRRRARAAMRPAAAAGARRRRRGRRRRRRVRDAAPAGRS
ncbi:unnamed protein product, partial [Coccothraustes coccothraustes]